MKLPILNFRTYSTYYSNSITSCRNEQILLDDFINENESDEFYVVGNFFTWSPIKFTSWAFHTKSYKLNYNEDVCKYPINCV